MALDIFRKAVDILNEEIPEPNRYIAEIYQYIGRVYASKRDYERALQYQFDALEVRKKCLAPDLVVFAFNYEAIADVYSYQRKHHKALDYHMQALELRQKYLPATHHNTAWSLHQVGKILYKACKPKEALKYDQAALAMMEKCSINNSQSRIIRSILDHMILINKNRPSEALLYQLQLLAMEKNSDRVNHTDIVGTLFEIYLTYWSMNMFGDALRSYKEALDIQLLEELDGESKLAGSFHRLATKYEILGDMRCALDCYHQALEINKRIYCLNHPFCVSKQRAMNRLRSNQPRRQTITTTRSTRSRRYAYRYQMEEHTGLFFDKKISSICWFSTLPTLSIDCFILMKLGLSRLLLCLSNQLIYCRVLFCRRVSC